MRIAVAVAAALALLSASVARGAAAPSPPPGSLAGPPAAAAVARGVVLPVDGPLLRLFEAPATPYAAGHRGVDLAALPGSPVRAALPGVVTFAGPVAGRGWVTIDHGGGLETTYGDLAPRLVSAGRRVAAGDVLGRLAAGRAWVDWGARRDGDYIDPLTLLGAWRVHLAAADG